ncbi:MAG: hypothetical protein QM728_09245 [Gordonia sp. (in: high G+C Gram-positive bacteria)]|uniref:hypothetical protein n=1 Tax=Gordonia sp. (in: high G+C Gram-positive bacteria) TaxID=84139 RepID=UPI0039E57737
MTHKIAPSRRRQVAAALVAVAAAAGLTGCTVSGKAKAPNPQIVTQYVQKHNAETQCAQLSDWLSSVNYNRMIDHYNANQNFGGLDKQIIAELDKTIVSLRAAAAKDMPADLKTQFGKVADVYKTQRDALAGGNIDQINASARERNEAAQQLRSLCRTYY